MSDSNDKSSPQPEELLPEEKLMEHELHSTVLREKTEPQESHAYPPLIMWVIFMVGCVCAGYYFSATSDGFNWDHFDLDNNPFEAGAAGAAVYDPIAKGARVYKNKCQVCHQADGMGLSLVYPPLGGSDWINKSPEILVRAVLNGMAGEITVNGEIYNNAMTSFAGDLSDKQIAEVLSYVRNSWGNSAPLVTEAEVTAIRAAVGTRTTAYAPDELLELFPE